MTRKYTKKEATQWIMKIQRIGGSYLVCLPKDWVKSNVPPDSAYLQIDKTTNNNLNIKPLEVPKIELPD